LHSENFFLFFIYPSSKKKKSLKGQRDSGQRNVTLLEVSVEHKANVNLSGEFVDHGLTTAGIVTVSVRTDVVSESLRVQPVSSSANTLKAQVELVQILLRGQKNEMENTQ
jgi:hypothetical protein